MSQEPPSMRPELSDCLSSWQLDQLELDAMSSRDARLARAHIQQCERCEAQLALRRKDAQDVAGMSGFGELLSQLSEQAARQTESTPAPTQTSQRDEDTWPWWRIWSLSGMSMAALAAMILAFQPAAIDPGFDTGFAPGKTTVSTTSQRPVAKRKVPLRKLAPAQLGKSQGGVFAVVHFHKGKKYSQWTRPGQQLQPGDLIQFAYQLPKAMHVMIASINEQGQISVFFPLGGRRSAQLRSGAGTLPHKGSLELDDYLGKERILIATSPEPIAYNRLQEAIQKAFRKAGRKLEGMGDVAGPWRCQSLLIQKTRQRNPSSRGVTP